MLRLLTRPSASPSLYHPVASVVRKLSWLRSRRQAQKQQVRKQVLAFSTSNVRRGQRLHKEGPACIAAVSAHQCTKRNRAPTQLQRFVKEESWVKQTISCRSWDPSKEFTVVTAVDDCLERVLGPSANSNSEFAVVFFEGHRGFEVQEALESFSERRPQAPPVIGCSLGDGGKRQRQQIVRARASSSALASSSLSALQQALSPSSFRTPSIVTVLGLGFGGRVEAIPVFADGGSFPSIAGDDSISRIFALPREKQPVFLLLSRRAAPTSDLEETFGRLGNLLPGSTRLSALSSGDPSCVVSSFPGVDAPVVGLCLLGDISLQEQADLARKTLGAFGVDGISVFGGVCDELFVPSSPTSTSISPPTSPTLPDSSKSLTTEMNPETGGAERGMAQSAVSQLQQQLCVFMVDDILFPGMTRRFRIFEPRYRALVKRCLSEGEPLAILPLSRGGNTVGTAAYVSGLHNVEADGKCEIEITGITRCHVKTMWMRGESFGLHEAVVEYFRDETQQESTPNAEINTESITSSYTSTGSRSGSNSPIDEREGTVGQDPRRDDAASSAVAPAAGSDRQGVPSRDGSESPRGDKAAKTARHEGDGSESIGEEVRDEELATDLPEVEQMRIQVSAVIQRELFRTRETGRSPLWPWNAVSEDNLSSGEGGGSGNHTALEPCDLDAEALSYWAAQNIEADVLTKHRWLSCTSTEERLRDIRDVCEAIMSRHRDRSGVDGSMLSRPLSALKDLRTK